MSLLDFFLPVKVVKNNKWSSSSQKISVENTIPPLLNAYHVIRSCHVTSISWK